MADVKWYEKQQIAEVTASDIVMLYDAETGATRTVTAANLAESMDGLMPQYATNYDKASATIAYVGEALPGSLGSAAVWRIKRLDTTGGDLVTTWAGGNANFDNVWDNRASLEYS